MQHRQMNESLIYRPSKIEDWENLLESEQKQADDEEQSDLMKNVPITKNNLMKNVPITKNNLMKNVPITKNNLMKNVLITKNNLMKNVPITKNNPMKNPIINSLMLITMMRLILPKTTMNHQYQT